MRDYSPHLLMLAVLAFLGVKGLPPSHPPATPHPAAGHETAPDRRTLAPAGQPVKSTALPRTDAALDEEFWHPLAHYWDPTVFERPRNPAEPPWPGFPNIPGHELEYLIMAVPDPVDSSSGYRFDRLVDAFQRAVETQHYVLDRYWFPWRRPFDAAPEATAAQTVSVSPAGDRGAQPGPSFALRVEPERTLGKLRDYERQPGVLLFRGHADREYHHGKKPRLLLVFLVGETATAGVHKEALRASLEFVSRLEGFQQTKRVRILGPYFSGSQRSLELGIGKWWWSRAARQWLAWDTGLTRSLLSLALAARALPAPARFQVVTGSATAIDKISMERRLPPGSCFSATVIPDRVVFTRALQYLGLFDDGGNLTERVALVAESNTAFGENLHNHVRTGNHFANVVVLPFPLQISNVRVAYAKSRAANGTNPPLVPTFGSRLKIPLEEATETRDTETTLAPAMTAVTSELLLSAMLTTIAHEGIKYVVVAASDVKDCVFLVSLVRERCPDVQLILLDADAIFGHPEIEYALRGTVIASTYPLEPANQEWSFPFAGTQRHLVFAGQFEEGCYNAALALLDPAGRNGRMISYGPPFWNSLDRGGSPTPGTGSRPPVWISMVGAGGLQPLHYYVGTDRYPAEDLPPRSALRKAYDDYVFEAPYPVDDGAGPLSGRFEVRYPISWWLLTVGVGLFCGYVAYGFFTCLRRHGLFATPASWWLYREQPHPDLRAFFVLVRHGALLLLLFFLLTVFLALVGARSGDIRHEGWLPEVSHAARLMHGMAWAALLLFPLAVLIAGIDLACCAAALVRWRAGTSAKRPATVLTPTVRMRLLITAAVFLCGVGVLLTFLGVPQRMARRQLGDDAALFFLRAINPANGVTPIVPVLFLALAFYWWGSCELKRRFLKRHFRVPDPCHPGGGQTVVSRSPLLKRIGGCRQKVDEMLVWSRATFGSRQWLSFALPLPVLAVALGGVFARIVPPAGPERWPFLVAGYVAVPAFSLVLLVSLVRAWKTWDRIHDLLRAVAVLPLGDAFSRIPRKATAVFGPYLSTARGDRTSQMPVRLRQARLVAGQYGRVQDKLRDYHASACFTQLETAFRYSAIKTRAEQEAEALHDESKRVPLYCWSVAEGIVWPDGPTRPVAATAVKSGNGQVQSSDKATVIPTNTPAHRRDNVAELRVNLHDAAYACLCVLELYWPNRCLREAYKDADPAGNEDGSKRPAARIERISDEDVNAPYGSHNQKAVRKWLRMAEDFVAIETLAFLSQYFVQLRKQVEFLAFAPLLLLLAIVSYPFRPQQLALWFFWALFLAIAATVTWIFVSIERDEIVSRVAGTTPNRFNLSWAFTGSILQYVVPLLGVLAALSADSSDLIHSWLDPILRTLH
jgi:hypothetical protein